jgi:molecular chaperone DnaK
VSHTRRNAPCVISVRRSPAACAIAVEEKIKAVREVLKGSDNSLIRSNVEDLERTMQRVGQEIYSQSQPGTEAGTGAGRGSSPGEEGTIEGEYREV